MKDKKEFEVTQQGDHLKGHFVAMAGPCELLFDTLDKTLVHRLMTLAFAETQRIEHKFSRYRPDSDVSRINQSNGSAVCIDAETYRLLKFADTCYQLSNGMFDITSGVLRKCWRFDGSDKIPANKTVEQTLPLIGWEKIQLSEASVTLPVRFELDLGGIGKEYAVDRVANQVTGIAPGVSVLVNFGGDIQVTCPKKNEGHWYVGIEDPNNDYHSSALVKIADGGLATSGDARRFLLKDGIRYSHILNPKTGFPIAAAPRSVSVAASTCIESGLIATLAMLEGKNAETFLKQQDVLYWCYW